MSPLQNYQSESRPDYNPFSVTVAPAATRQTVSLATAQLYADSPKAWLYGPVETFSLSMASHGLSVSSSMMLDDQDYAHQQLACAQTLGDELLTSLAQALTKQLKMLC